MNPPFYRVHRCTPSRLSNAFHGGAIVKEIKGRAKDFTVVADFVEATLTGDLIWTRSKAASRKPGNRSRLLLVSIPPHWATSLGVT